MSKISMKKKMETTHPDAVEDIAVGKDSDVQVRLDNVVKLCLLLIPEESVRHPDLDIKHFIRD